MTQFDAILIDEDSTIVVVNLPANPENFAEYTAAVLRCSNIEAFDLTDGVVIWLDEEGRDRWGYNALIDGLVNRYGHINSLHGPALITGYGARVEPLPQATAHRILTEINRITDH